jgi:hypothetical protein
MTDEDWKTLKLKKPGHTSNGNGGKANGNNGNQETHGSFHEQFSIGTTLLRCVTHVDAECAVEHDEAIQEYKTLTERIRALHKQYGSFEAIPAHKLLSISLEEVSAAHQKEQHL